MSTHEAQSMELVIVQTAITSMDKLSAGLKDLQQRFGGVVFDVKTAKGMSEAKAARREVAAPRIEVEKVRVEAKKPILELGRKLDAEAKRITEAIDKIEAPIAQQIKTEEDRVENERLAKVRREEQRVAAISGRIEDMRGAVNGAARARTSAEVVRLLADVQKVVVDLDHFAEFMETAKNVKENSVVEIERIRDEMVARENEAEQLRRDREEFDRKVAAQEATDRARREREEDIRERLAELNGNTNLTASCGTALITEHIEDLKKIPVTEEIFGEYLQQAIAAREAGIVRLEGLYNAAYEHQREQDRLTVQREQQRKEEERMPPSAASSKPASRPSVTPRQRATARPRNAAWLPSRKPSVSASRTTGRASTRSSRSSPPTMAGRPMWCARGSRKCRLPSERLPNLKDGAL